MKVEMDFVVDNIEDLESKIEMLRAQYAFQWLVKNTNDFDVCSLTKKDLIGIYTVLETREKLLKSY